MTTDLTEELAADLAGASPTERPPRGERSPDPADRDEIPRCWTEEACSIPGAFRFGERVKPWNWLELDAEEAEKLWSLLIAFVRWFNRRYGERSDRRIPPCWAEHGPVVEELTTLMFARWHAFESVHGSVGGAQYWHTHTLPGFYTRLHEWLRDDQLSCGQGVHRDHPDPELERELSWADRTNQLADLDVRHRREAASRHASDQASPTALVEVPFLDEAKEQSTSRKVIR